MAKKWAEFKKRKDFNKGIKKLKNLSEGTENAAIKGLKKVGLQVEAIAVKHLNEQDLPWEPLKPATIANKVRSGGSELTLIDTSTMMQNITSYYNAAEKSLQVGVKRGVSYPGGEGEEISDIAAVQEYGSLARGIPARPLWQPTAKETKEWVQQNEPIKKEILKYLKTQTDRK